MAKVKKGHRTWKPAQKLTVKNENPEIHPKWCQDDPINIQRKLDEGYFFINKTTGAPIEYEGTGMVPDTKSIDSAVKVRELVLMGLDDETYEARKAYFAERTKDQTNSLKKFADQEDAKSAAANGVGNRSGISGKIVIE
jgi:hypothetical protein